MENRKIVPKVVLATVGTLLVVGAIPAQAASPSRPAAITITPAQHTAFVQARVNSQARINRVLMHIDSRQVKPTILWHQPGNVTVRYPLNQVSLGRHSARVTVRDNQSRTHQTQWSFYHLEQRALRAEATTVHAGDTVKVSGQGFTPGFRVWISRAADGPGTAGSYTSVIVDAQGRFSQSIPLTTHPDGSPVAPGTLVLVAHSKNFKQQASAQLQVLAAPSLSASKTTIKPDDRITLTGQGFTPGTALTIAMGGVNMGASGNYGTATAGSDGRFSLDVTLSRLPDGTPLHPGAIVLTAHSADFSEKAAVQLQVEGTPSLSSNKTSFKPGETLTLNGQGFTPGANLIVSMGGPNTGAGGNYGQAVADGRGQFSINLRLDRYPDGSLLHAGPIVLMAGTPDGREKAALSLQVLADPTLSVNKTNILAGDTVTLTGSGFTPGMNLIIGMGAPNTGASGNYGAVTVDSNGRFRLDVNLARYSNGALLQPGPIVLLAHNADGSEKAQVGVQVLQPPKPANPTIALNKSSVRLGEPVLVTGNNFAPGASITLRFSPATGTSTYEVGRTVADSTGRFAAQITLGPTVGSPYYAGIWVLTAQTTDLQGRASAQLQLITDPAITLDRSVIRPGDEVTVRGQGFVLGSAITMSMGGVNTGASGNYGTAMVGANGTFSLRVTLSRYPDGSPLQPGGIVLVAHDNTWAQRASVLLDVQGPVSRPDAPSDLRVTSVVKGATSAEPTTVNLQWRDNAANEDGFRIRVTFTRMNGGTETEVREAPANSTVGQVNFVAGGINPITKATFTVAAFNAQGESNRTNEVSIDL